MSRPYHSTPTRLRQVLAALHAGPLTLEELRVRINLGRARVYVLLQTLLQEGRVTRTPHHGKWGRPAHLYHFVRFEKSHVQSAP